MTSLRWSFETCWRKYLYDCMLPYFLQYWKRKNVEAFCTFTLTRFQRGSLIHTGKKVLVDFAKKLSCKLVQNEKN